MATEEALLGRGNGEADEDQMEQLRRSLSRFSLLLKARKAGRQWHQKSKSQRSGEDHEQDDEEQQRNESCSGWRSRLGEALESTPAHVAIVTLLLVDLLATAVDLLLTIHNTSADLRECSASVQACICDATGFSSSRKQWEFLHWISVGILCVLELNVLGLIIAFGLDFFRHAGYILDLFVVTSAFVLEVFFEADTAGLLIILNLWRIVRVAHGIFEVTDEAWENELEDMRQRLESAEMNFKQEAGSKDQRILELESEVNVLRGNNQVTS